MKKYVIDITVLNQNNTVASDCNAITFVNTGVGTVKINDFVLAVNTSLVIEGNENEIDITSYQVMFPSNAGNLTIFRKYYK